jgi:hypothetical protein
MSLIGVNAKGGLGAVELFNRGLHRAKTPTKQNPKSGYLNAKQTAGKQNSNSEETAKT